METISQLRDALLSSLGGHGSQLGEQKLFDLLMQYKSRLSNVFDVGARNPQEQREIESGVWPFYFV